LANLSVQETGGTEKNKTRDGERETQRHLPQKPRLTCSFRVFNPAYQPNAGIFPVRASQFMVVVAAVVVGRYLLANSHNKNTDKNKNNHA